MGAADFGNRSWRIETPKGPALQKLYRERGGALSVLVREILIAAARTKTSQRARARRATERRLLRHWRERGFTVPQDWTEDLPAFGGPDVAVLEFVEGAVPLWDLLVRPALDEERRVAVLRSFAAEWGRRHAEAVRASDAELVQEHGSIRHVLVAGDRQVSIDLEQAFLPCRDVRPLVAKEIAATLRSLWKRVGEERYAKDLAVVVAAYPDPSLLRGAADAYLRARGARRLMWAIDRALRNERRRRAKYGALERLDEELRHRGI
jgi:hypothetical protein